MNKQFVTYEIALALKELSFNEPCFGRWFIGDDSYKEAIFFNQDHNNKVISNSNITEGYSILAPLWQQVIDWVDLKGYWIELGYCNDKTIFFVIHEIGGGILYNQKGYEIMHLAREQAILTVLEFINNLNK